jgi:tRNA-dependent cyclodipeptide synthase
MKYKIKVKDIQPSTYSAIDKFPDKCFLGVSLSNPFFQGKHLERVLKWIDENFAECEIIIADHLHRFNEYTFNGKNGKEAETECIEMGKQIHERIKFLTQSLQSKKFKINHWLSFINTKEFDVLSKNINDNFSNNDAFKECILKSCEEFIEKQLGRGYHIFVTKDEAINKSKDYLLEEMAVFSILINRGFTVQIYPGTQLKVLKQLANKKFPTIDNNLSRGIYIDLSVKKIR